MTLEQIVELFGCSAEQAKQVVAIMESCEERFHQQRKATKVRHWIPMDYRWAIKDIAQVLHKETDFILAHWSRDDGLVDAEHASYLAKLEGISTELLRKVVEDGTPPNAFFYVSNSGEQTLGWDSICGDFRILRPVEWLKVSAEEQILHMFEVDLYYEFTNAIENRWENLFFSDRSDALGLFHRCCELAGQELVIDAEGFVEIDTCKLLEVFSLEMIEQFKIEVEEVPQLVRDRRIS